MAIAHLRSEFEALSGWQSSHRRLAQAGALVRGMAARYPRAELRDRCLECALLLREEGLCHQLLGHRLRSAYCTLFALEMLMHTVGVDQSLASDLTPRIIALSDQLLTF